MHFLLEIFLAPAKLVMKSKEMNLDFMEFGFMETVILWKNFLAPTTRNLPNDSRFYGENYWSRRNAYIQISILWNVIFQWNHNFMDFDFMELFLVPLSSIKSRVDCTPKRVIFI
jgi:hypothetical protein